MKEKVDMHLSVVTLCQLVLVGFGGTFLNELTIDTPRWTVVIVFGLSTAIAFIVMQRHYSKAKQNIKKIRKWQQWK
jgi:hypothetical protein